MRLFLLLLLAAAASAQTSLPGELALFDGSAEFAWRPLGPTAEGELLQKFPARFLGHLGPLKGLRATVQDEERATPEQAWVVLRRADAKGAPDLTPQGLLHQEGPYPFSGAGAGPAAWRIAFLLAGPLSLPEGDLFAGLRFPSGAGPSDFASLQLSADYPKQPCGEHPRQAVQAGLGWMVLYSGGAPASATELGYNLAWDLGLLLEHPVLQAFAVDPASPCASKRGRPDFGYAALWPDMLDLEKYGYYARFGWRLEHHPSPSAIGLLFLSSRKLAAPIPLGASGSWFLDPFDPWFSLVLTLTLDPGGVGSTQALDPPSALRPLMAGTWLHAQAVLLTGSTLTLSTLSAVGW